MPHAARLTVWILFFFSGTCALVYQTTWMRLFRLVMGNTVYTSATVLTVFMAGLAAGSWWAGRIVDREPRPLRLYAWLEVGIAAAALMVLGLFEVFEPVYGLVHGAFADVPVLLGIGRFLLSAVLLIVPTTLMGATLPLLSRYVTSARSELGREIGRLYALNTLGAAVGAGIAGFVLVPQLGVTSSILLAAVGNAAIAAAAWRLSRRHEEGVAPATVTPSTPATGATGATAVLVAIAGAGFASMIYEVAWTRVLSMLLGSSVYAFSLMLIAFITGLGLGGALLSLRIDRVRQPLWVLAGLEAFVGLSALAVVPLFGELPVWIVDLVAGPERSYRALLSLEFGIIFLLMLGPTLAMGGVFPTVARIYTTDGARVGRSVGDIYAVNTLGAVAGSFIAGFLLVPWIGVQSSILVGVAVNLLIAGWFFAAIPWRGRGPALAAAAVALVAVAVAMPRWDPMLINSAPSLYAQRYRSKGAEGEDLAQVMTRNRRLLYADEGLTASVTVVESGGELFLKVNGKTDASSRGDLRSQSLLAHLPLLLHAQPDEVLLIGLGSGISLGAAQLHPLRRIECVEISPEVVDGARFFRDVNHDALSDPRLQLIIGDGRNHLAFSDRRYDLVISQPSNLWIAGMADLFSREFFGAVRQRLAPGGVACTWIQAYAMLESDFQVILKTFREQFPHVAMWESVPGGDYFLVGSEVRLDLDVEAIRARVETRGLAADLQRIGVGEVDNLLCSYVMDGAGVDRYTASAAINTDDNALLEFSAPRGLFAGNRGDWERVFDVGDLGAVRAAAPPFDGVDAELRAHWEIRQQALAAAGLEQRGRTEDALRRLDAVPAGADRDMEFRRLLSRLVLDKGEVLERRGRAGAARQLYAETIERLGGGDPQLDFRFGRAAQALERTEEALAAFDRARSLEPDFVAPHLHAAALRMQAGDLEQAEADLAAALRADPHSGQALADWGRLEMRRRRWDAAFERFVRAAELLPHDAEVRNNAGVARFQQQRYAEALEWFGRALRIRPGYVRAYNNTAEAHMALGDTEGARQALAEALRREPLNRRSLFLRQRLEGAGDTP